MKGENDRYLEGHPEMRPLLDEFVGAIMRDKPSDIIKYGALFFSTLRTQSVMGQSPLVITGPPTIGKTMFIRMLIDKYPNTFGTAVQHTTRVKREGEVQGVDHFFVEKASFEESVRNGDFADYYTLHTNLYATSLKAVEKVCLQF